MHLARSNEKYFFLILFSCNGFLKYKQFACSKSKGKVLTVKSVI